MTKKKLFFLNVTNILVFFILGSLFFAGSTAIESLHRNNIELRQEIEDHWRSKSRNTLKDTLSVFEYDFQNNENLDIMNFEDVSRWSSVNFGGIRTKSISSYAWIGEIGKAVYVDDQRGRHVLVSDDPYRSLDMDYDIYDDPINAETVYDRILYGHSPSVKGDNFTWVKDGVTEWVEFAYYPERGGINDEPKTIGGFMNEDYIKYVFVITVSENEIMDRYEYIFIANNTIISLLYIVMAGSFIISILFLLSIIFIKPFKQRRCSDER